MKGAQVVCDVCSEAAELVADRIPSGWLAFTPSEQWLALVVSRFVLTLDEMVTAFERAELDPDSPSYIPKLIELGRMVQTSENIARALVERQKDRRPGLLLCPACVKAKTRP